MRRVRVWVLVLVLGLVATPATGPHPVVWPSIILIVLDACRADHVSALGYSRQTTPNIDRLAADGLAFTQHYSATNGTIMGVSQLLASALRPLPLISAPDGPPLADDNAIGSLPDVLANAGYQTALFAGHPYFHPRFAPITRVFTTFSNVASLKPSDQKANLVDILDQFEPWLAGQQAPFFAYLHAMDTHFPHPLRSKNPTFADRRFLPSFRDGAAPAEASRLKNDVERQYVIDLYDEDLHEADRAIGRLVETLTRLGRLDNTIVVITADHGEQLYETGYAGHGGGIGNLPDAETHIPLIIRFGRKVRQERVGGITRSIDVTPTILDLAGLPIPAWMMGTTLIRRDGVSFAFDPNSASPFAPIFNQDRDPVRVALRFPRMKYFTRSAARDPVASIGPEADEMLVAIGDGDGVIADTDPRFAEARNAWRHLLQLLSHQTHPTDDAVRGLRERLRTLGYVGS